MKKILMVCVLVLCGVGLFFSCNGGGEDVVKIAVVGPQTGDYAEYGKGFVEASKIMVDQWGGEILGKKVELVSFDDKNDPKEAAIIAEKIVSDSQFVGVIGHFASGVCMAASPTYQNSKIVEISPSASHPDYTKEGDYIFRNNTVIRIEAAVSLEMAIHELGGQRLGLAILNNDWGQSTRGIIKELVSDRSDCEIVQEVVFNDSETDFNSLITMMEDASVDVIIVIAMYRPLAGIANAAVASGNDFGIVGFSNAYNQELINLGRENVENVYFPTIFFHESNDPKVQDFVKTYVDRYGKTPSSLTAQAYDSTGILLDAIQRAGTLDEKAIRDAVATTEYDGVTGVTTFDEIGDAVKSFNQVRVQNGSFVIVP